MPRPYRTYHIPLPGPEGLRVCVLNTHTISHTHYGHTWLVSGRVLYLRLLPVALKGAFVDFDSDSEVALTGGELTVVESSGGIETSVCLVNCLCLDENLCTFTQYVCSQVQLYGPSPS